MTPRPKSSQPRLSPAVRRSLRDTFGIGALREGQQEVIAQVLAGEDVLAIMPTGAGKSLCWQLPALHSSGTTVVVSPLISLMKDQADKLGEAGVAAEQLNSAQTVSAQAESMLRLAEQRSAIVFATPERLADDAFIESLQAQGVALFVIDEAHCITQWGHDFRPAFLGIGAALVKLGKPPVLALTATATAAVVDDIRQQLGRPRMAVVNTGLYRPNLRLQVVQCVREDEKFDKLLEALGNAEARGHGTGIVYTATVKACIDLAERLEAAGHAVTRYHGKLPKAERHANQDRFMHGDARVMVATPAFGMGIDKADLRFVLHYQMPGSPSSYYQEAGRAGRDGEQADCVLLFFRRDRQVQQFFMARRYPSADDLQQTLAVLQAADAPLGVKALEERLPDVSRNKLAVVLALLRDAGLASASRAQMWRFQAPKHGDLPPPERLAADYEQRADKDRESLERMVFYAQTGFCRWRVLLEYFDEPMPFEGERCGHCDNCLRAPVEAAEEVEPAAEDAESAEPPFRIGDEVRVPRYGTGTVEGLAGDEVSVVFPDSSRRSFVCNYVALATPGALAPLAPAAASSPVVVPPGSPMPPPVGAPVVAPGAAEDAASSASSA